MGLVSVALVVESKPRLSCSCPEAIQLFTMESQLFRPHLWAPQLFRLAQVHNTHA